MTCQMLALRERDLWEARIGGVTLFSYWAPYIEETISLAVFDSVFVPDFASEDAKSS